MATSVAAQDAPRLTTSDDAATPYVVVADGFAVYAYTADAQGQPVCVDACAETWVPVLVVDSVGFGPGIELRRIGSIARTDGAVQLTYNDWPLYRYAGDAEPGDTHGNGVDGAWFVLDPGGDMIRPNSASDDPLFALGAEVFASVCADCHGADGSGRSAPRLVGRASLSDATDIARKIIRGFGYMPALGGELSNDEIAAALTFVRNSWGNEFGAVTPEEVQKAR